MSNKRFNTVTYADQLETIGANTMSKIGNHRIEIQENDDYRFGWESAERGEPEPNWQPQSAEQRNRLYAQRLGRSDYSAQDIENGDTQ